MGSYKGKGYYGGKMGSYKGMSKSMMKSRK